MIGTRRMRWSGHVVCMLDLRNVYRLLVGKTDGKKLFGRPRCKWEDNIKMDYKETGLDGVD
jgi:hypothetical protein